MTIMNTEQKEIFLRALYVIRSEDRWCQEVFARDVIHRPVDLATPNACSFCTMGAIIKARGEDADGLGVLGNEMIAYVRYTHDIGLAGFNDNNTYETVINMWIMFGKDQQYLPADFTMDQLETLLPETVV